MTYTQDSLAFGEHIVLRTSPHWIAFLPAGSILLLAFFMAGWGAPFLIFEPFIEHGFLVHHLLAYLAGLIGLAQLVRAFIFYTTTEYAITNKRIIMKRGFIRRFTIEIFLSRIEGINIHQTIPGRILGYGTVVLVGTGGTNDFCMNLPDPVGFRRLVQQQLV